jgi:hypothetical protein
MGIVDEPRVIPFRRRAPAFAIRLELEVRPRLYADTLNEGEWKRLLCWLDSSDELRELVRLAFELEEAAA